jgi:MFS transporter, UMF1 family
LQVKQNGSSKDIYKVEEKISSQLSVMMLVFGLPAGIFVLTMCTVIALIMEDKLLALKVGCVLSGVWWISVMTFPTLWLKNRADPPLPK